MRYIFALCAAALILCGCTSTDPRLNSPHAIINDVTVPTADQSGYRLATVDGKPVERIQSPGLATMIPFAIVKPGVHSLGLEPEKREDRQPTTVTATFEDGKRYRIKAERETVTVVEERN